MKFKEIFRFEVSYQLGRAWPWAIATLLIMLVFLFMRDGSLSEAMYTEFFINSPFMVAMATVFGNLLWLLMGAFIAGEAAARDTASGIHPLIYSSPLTKAEYLGGRFLAAFTLNACILLIVQFAILLAIYLPGVHPDSIGPFRPAAFLTAYFYIAIPNAFAATAIQFTFSLFRGRPIVAYIGSLLLFFTAFFIASLILFRSGLGTLLDPIGIRFIWDELSHLWTTVEKSWRLLELKGSLLENRIVWLGIGLAFAAFAYFRFKFQHRVLTRFRFRIPIVARILSFISVRKPTAKILIESATARHQVPTKVALSTGFRLFIRQTFTITWASFRTLATSGPGLAMLFFIPILAIPVVIDQMVSLGLPLTPTTARVVSELTDPLTSVGRWMVIPGFIIYFIGELVWRERDYGLAEITDAMPGKEWAAVLGKLFGVAWMLVAFTVMLIFSGLVSQALMDYDKLEIALYLKIMFGLQLPEYLLFAALVMFIHALVDQKYVGHLVAIVSYAFIAAISTMLGIEHKLLIFGAAPGWTYTEMRGFGPFIQPWLWFKAYWAAWALLLIIIATLFWPRGKEKGLRVRLQLAKHRLKHQAGWVIAAPVALIVLIGGFIFYNTNMLNKYVNSREASEIRAGYEKKYGRYENIPQPEITQAKLNIELFPKEGSMETHGSYALVNKAKVDIDSIHISTSIGGANTNDVSFDQKVTLTLNDGEHHYRIYKLEKPLRPGDMLKLDFKVSVSLHGFRNTGADPFLVESGSFFTNQNWFPAIGYQRTRGVINPAERRERGLEPRPVIASLYEAHEGEAISLGTGISLEAVIGTSADQVAVAPGHLLRSWKDDSSGENRNYFHYATSAPIGNEWAFFSANYNAYEQEWTSPDDAHRRVVVRIYHYPGHTGHLKHMMESVVSCLTYYSKTFGAYPYDHLTVIEHPAAPGTGMHSDPSLIYYGQGYPYWLPKDSHKLDFPYAVMGHEMGHQWTLPYAFVEGLPFLSEGIAWHYGIMMVKATRNAEQTRKLMSFMRQPYPYQPIRHGEPLLRAVDPYLAYKRGPLAMFALSKYAGADRVNRAIRTLNEKSNDPNAHPVTTLDLYHELKAVMPDSLQPMLHDLFEVNTLWQMSVRKIAAVKTGKDKWDVTLDVSAKKIVYDSAGVETEMPMDEWIPIGVFAERQAGHDELSSPSYLKLHRIHSGNQSITVSVSREPVLAGIDPHHLLDWEEKEDDDNIEQITTAENSSSSQ